MANDINLINGDGITLKLVTGDNGTLSININKARLDSLIAELVSDTSSATYNAIKTKVVVDKAAKAENAENANTLDSKDSTAFAAASHKHVLANITDLQIDNKDHDNTKKVHIKY